MESSEVQTLVEAGLEQEMMDRLSSQAFANILDEDFRQLDLATQLEIQKMHNLESEELVRTLQVQEDERGIEEIMREANSVPTDPDSASALLAAHFAMQFQQEQDERDLAETLEDQP
jgi:hypothetical protein